MMISRNFSMDEAVESNTARRFGINNTPSLDIINNIKRTAEHLETVRAELNKPIIVSSWYRSPELNKAVDGASNSQHMQGRAVDFIAPQFGSPMDICKCIVRSGIGFDQLIMEHTWVHISFCDNPRKEVLELVVGGGYRPLSL